MIKTAPQLCIVHDVLFFSEYELTSTLNKIVKEIERVFMGQKNLPFFLFK
jgi:hypothetical protein